MKKEEDEMYVGTILYGFCNGYFGRDSYEDKRIEAIGADWIVARDEYGHIHMATFDNTKEMEVKIAEWSKESEKML